MDLELLLFQNPVQIPVCDVLKECKLLKNTAAVDSTDHIITRHIKFYWWNVKLANCFTEDQLCPLGFEPLF